MSEKNPENLNIPQRVFQLLFTEKHENKGKWIKKGVLESFRYDRKFISARTVISRATKLAIVSALLFYVSVLGDVSKEKRANAQTNSRPNTVNTRPSTQPNTQSNPNGKIVEILTSVRLDASNPEKRTLWGLVKKYLEEKRMDYSDQAVDEIADKFKEKYPEADPTRFQDRQEFRIIENDKGVRVEMIDG